MAPTTIAILASMMTGRFFSANSWAMAVPWRRLNHVVCHHCLAIELVRLQELLRGDFMPFHLRTRIRRHGSPYQLTLWNLLESSQGN